MNITSHDIVRGLVGGGPLLLIGLGDGCNGAAPKRTRRQAPFYGVARPRRQRRGDA